MFKTANRILTGQGALEEIGQETKRLGAHALVVAGKGALRAAKVLDRVLWSLEKAGARFSLFEGVPSEPTTEVVDAGLNSRSDCDVVVAIGGGSVMDVGKAMGGAWGEPVPEVRPFRDYLEGLCQVESPGIPVICVPTTAGSGAEVTQTCVLINGKTGRKKSLRGEPFRAVTVILDPETTTSCPREVTAYAGADALVQAVESYVSCWATPLSEEFSLAALRRIGPALPAAIENPGDLGAREDLLVGAMLAGMALDVARLGIVHGVASPLGGRFSLPHGRVCGALLPAAIRFNEEACADKYRLAARTVFSREVTEVAGAFAEYFSRLAVPVGLAGTGITEKDFADIAAEAMTSASTKANPRPLTEPDLVAFLALACERRGY